MAVDHPLPAKTKARDWFVVAVICTLVGMNVGRTTTMSHMYQSSTKELVEGIAIGGSPRRSGVALAQENATSSSSSGNMKKPRLLLHIGPKKTGTTYIQLKILGKSKVRSVLQKQNVSLVDYNFRDFKRLLFSCLEKPVNDTQCVKQGMWSEYRKKLVGKPFDKLKVGDYDLQHHTVLSSIESYSRMPDNGFCRHSFGSLQNEFDVTALVFYRRLAGWFPSEYKQRRKALMMNSRISKYLQFSKGRLPTFADYVRTWTGYDGRDTLSSIEVFESIFGRENIKVLSYHAENIGEEFLCKGLSHLPGACDIGKKLPSDEVKNDNSALLFDEDWVVSEAFRQSLFPEKHVKRRTATTVLKAYWDAKPERRKNLPKSCLTSSLSDWMWNRTIATQRYLVQNYPNSIIAMAEDELREEFNETAATKFCDVDVQVLFQDKSFKEFLSSCAFALPHTKLRNGSVC